MKKALQLFFTLAFALMMSLNASACPGCSVAVGSGAATSREANLGMAFSYSIYFMLGVVLSMVGFMAFKVTKMIRAENARHAEPKATLTRRAIA